MSTPSRTTYNEVEKIWYGNTINSKYDKKQSIGSVILEALQKEPEYIAQISYTTGKKTTNKEILLLSIRIAQNLEKLNVQQCDIVGICAANSDFVAPLVFGCLYKGLTISTLDPSFDKDGIKHIYSITKPKLMFCDGSIYQRVREALDECDLTSTIIYTVKDHIEGVPNLNDLIKETQREHEFKCDELKMGQNQVAAIVCSSGTTGLPKGTCVSHTAILHGIENTPTGIQQTTLCFSTLYWMSGILALTAGTLSCYTRIISDNPFNAKDCLDILKCYKVTMLGGPPSHVSMLLACSNLQLNDLIHIKLCYFGGSAVPQTMVEKLKRYMPNALIMVGYGSTEIGGFVAAGMAIEDGYCGQVSSNVEVKILDDCNQNLGPGEIGEICARRKICPWSGYYGNPETTKETYDCEGWIRSGDLGYIDIKGNLYVVDRKKDILKYNNFHFYPTEIENVILELSDVVEVSVFGIPDIIYSYLPAAAIVKFSDSSLTEDMVYQHVTDRMVHFKQLRGGVYFMDELPKTPSGKIMRRKVTELCTNLYNTVNNKN